MIEIINEAMKDKLNEIHTSLPAKITAIDYEEGTCTVQIIPKRELCQKLIKYPPLIDVRLDFLKFGGWKLQFPRKVGDKVWVGFSENTISEKTSLERFSLNEPYIIGSCENNFENNSEDIILTGAGTRIEIKGNGSIVITTGNNKMQINSDIEINGNLNIKGDTTQEGTITASTDVIGGGKSLVKHTHKYKPGSTPKEDTDPTT